MTYIMISGGRTCKDKNQEDRFFSISGAPFEVIDDERLQGLLASGSLKENDLIYELGKQVHVRVNVKTTRKLVRDGKVLFSTEE